MVSRNTKSFQAGQTIEQVGRTNRSSFRMDIDVQFVGGPCDVMGHDETFVSVHSIAYTAYVAEMKKALAEANGDCTLSPSRHRCGLLLQKNLRPSQVVSEVEAQRCHDGQHREVLKEKRVLGIPEDYMRLHRTVYASGTHVRNSYVDLPHSCALRQFCEMLLADHSNDPYSPLPNDAGETPWNYRVSVRHAYCNAYWSTTIYAGEELSLPLDQTIGGDDGKGLSFICNLDRIHIHVDKHRPIVVKDEEEHEALERLRKHQQIESQFLPIVHSWQDSGSLRYATAGVYEGAIAEEATGDQGSATSSGPKKIIEPTRSFHYEDMQNEDKEDAPAASNIQSTSAGHAVIRGIMQDGEDRKEEEDEVADWSEDEVEAGDSPGRPGPVSQSHVLSPCLRCTHPVPQEYAFCPVCSFREYDGCHCQSSRHPSSKSCSVEDSSAIRVGAAQGQMQRVQQ